MRGLHLCLQPQVQCLQNVESNSFPSVMTSHTTTQQTGGACFFLATFPHTFVAILEKIRAQYMEKYMTGENKENEEGGGLRLQHRFETKWEYSRNTSKILHVFLWVS